WTKPDFDDIQWRRDRYEGAYQAESLPTAPSPGGPSGAHGADYVRRLRLFEDCLGVEGYVKSNKGTVSQPQSAPQPPQQAVKARVWYYRSAEHWVGPFSAESERYRARSDWLAHGGQSEVACFVQ